MSSALESPDFSSPGGSAAAHAPIYKTYVNPVLNEDFPDPALIQARTRLRIGHPG